MGIATLPRVSPVPNPYGFRNRIRNGDMGVVQRGVGPFTGSYIYTADGWPKGHVGGTHSVSLNTQGLGSGLGINGALRSLSSTVASQSAVGDYAVVYQRIESVRTLAGKQVTLSFLAYASSGTPSVGIEIEQGFGTGGSPSAVVQTAIRSVAISNAATTRYSVTFTVPSIVGKTLGTAGDDFLSINFWVSAGSSSASRASSIGIQNNQIDICDVQLEEGPAATPFERLPQQVQLAWCQRYYWRKSYGAATVGVSGIASYLSTQSFLHIQHPVPMRAAPTVVSTRAASDFTLYSNGGTTPLTGWSAPAAQQSPAAIEVDLGHAGATVGGNFIRTNNSAAYIDASAEL